MSYANTSLLLSLAGANGGTSFPDYSRLNVAITVNGDAKTSTVQSKFYGSSLEVDGTGDALTVPSVTPLGSALFTIRAWVRATVPTSAFILLDVRNGDFDNNGLVLYVRNTQKLTFGRGNPFVATEGPTNVSANTWHHFELTRDESNDVRGFLNGNLEFVVNDTKNFSRTQWRIGHQHNVSGTFSAGFIQDLHVIPGVCLHTAAFTPPGKLIGTLSNQGTGGEPVKDDAGSAAARTIIAVPRRYGAAEHNRAFHSVSDGSGDFSLSVPASAEFSDIDSYSVIALDDAAGTDYNDLVFGRVETV